MVVDILATYKQVSADKYLRINHIIALTNIGNTPVIPKEFGYVAFHKMEKIYMPLITDRIDCALQPYQKMERGSQVAYIEDILEAHGFTKSDNDIKVKAYVKIHTGKVYRSKKSINLNMNKLDEDGEKIADMIASKAIEAEELLPQLD
ncbi:hypothetical protein GCM10025884_20260 [Leuconostoc gelidum subsp. gelidum]|nr:hypothetical protein GCM10025884_20260 [Leuconostoc gelidum subsp. gelidum]